MKLMMKLNQIALKIPLFIKMKKFMTTVVQIEVKLKTVMKMELIQKTQFTIFMNQIVEKNLNRKI